MAVERVIFSSDGLGGSVEGQNPGSVTYKSKINLRILCAASDGPTVIYNHLQASSDLPWIGRSLRAGAIVDEKVRCTSITPEKEANGGGWWNIGVEYSQQNGGGGEDDKNNNGGRPGPDGKLTYDKTQWIREIETGAYQISVPMELATFKGFKGGFAGGMNAGGEALRLRVGSFGAVINSAGVPFDPPHEEVHHIKTFRVSRYKWSHDASKDESWYGAVNSEPVVIDWQREQFKDRWEALHAKVAVLGSRVEYDENAFFSFRYVWRETIEIHINRLGWRPLILDRGCERAAGSGDPDGKGGYISLGDIKPGQPLTRAIKDADGYPTATPVLLDGKGQPLDPGKRPVWLEYSNNVERPFSELGF